MTSGANVVVPVEPSSAVPEASASVSATSAPNTTATESSTGISIQATTDNPDGNQPQLTEYDALNRQTKVKIGNDVYKYGYNEDGLRIWKEVNGEKTYFVWDDNQIVLELNENGDLNKKHVRGLTLIYSEDDNASTDDKVFYNYNAHGDVVQLLDEDGTVTKYYQYDSFGNEINEDENDENPWRYCGEYYDKETGTIYLRARYYNPGYGRFTTEDPAQAGLNWYVYCDNEPIGFIDPNGLAKKKAKKKTQYLSQQYPNFPLGSSTDALKITINNNDVKIVWNCRFKVSKKDKEVLNTSYRTMITNAIEEKWSGRYTVKGIKKVKVKTTVIDKTVGCSKIYAKGQKWSEIVFKNKAGVSHVNWTTMFWFFNNWTRSDPGEMTLYTGDSRTDKNSIYTSDDFRIVAAHEFGHILGIDDGYDSYETMDYNSIMCDQWGWYNRIARAKRKATGIDIEKALDAYNSNKLQSW